MATVMRDAATRGGDALQKNGPVLSLFSTSTCRDPLQNPPMPGCPGYSICDHMHPPCTSGPSTVGPYPQGVQSLQKSIRRFGAHALRVRIVNDDQHDAYSAAEWMRRSDRDGTLMEFFAPVLSPQEQEVVNIEGWILGIK